jgi:hypothetical protein
MEISLFEEGASLAFERIVLYPYPDLKRVWTRIWLTAVLDESPNIEITLFNPDGSENTSVYMMAHADRRAETTLHLRDHQPGATYHVVAELSRGLTEAPEVIDRQEFDLLLEFRDPDRGDPGFGMGVNWNELDKRQGSPGEPSS